MNRSFLVLAVDTVRSIKPLIMRHALIAALVALTTALACVGGARAAAPLSKAPPVGFYRMMLGDYEVTALLDGVLGIPVAKFLTNTTSDEVERRLHANSSRIPSCCQPTVISSIPAQSSS